MSEVISLTKKKRGRQPNLTPKPRPNCKICGKPAHLVEYNDFGMPVWRNICGDCHRDKIAIRQGYKNHEEKRIAKHPSLRYRKDYCENIDGRLGFTCTSTITHPKLQLDGDHINGNPEDDREENIQTLCKNCHAVKTHMNKDYATIGRKKLKEMRKAA